MGDGKEKNSDGFDLKKELSTLVSQNILPSRIADKLDKKLEEKKIEINKEQLYTIANEIRSSASSPGCSAGIRWPASGISTRRPLGRLEKRSSITSFSKKT